MSLPSAASPRTVLVTGATGGIGLVTARELARQGERVLIVGRDPQKTGRVAGEIGAAGTFLADLSELAQVQRLAAQVREQNGQLDVLINNAGAFYRERQETREGIERTWALNHLSPFLLTRELLPLLRQSAAPRVITVASAAHAMGRLRLDDPEFRRGYGGWAAYAQSKLANILFARELARRERGVLSSSLHPGMVATGFAHNNGGWVSRLYGIVDRFALTPEQGAQTTLHVATAPLTASGRYYSESRETTPAPQALDDGAALALWQLSEAYVADIKPAGR
ncbi:SDR family oxidoreductase [Deinococcus multiflagellatus]|uniref:SDR family oxidoreductase n=1 Tax=Deinococcus multiflagellatus TaxID=1656887 RepID=UPI001CCBC2B9|nr:SDR family oxidoreductase [Deinococcus multiflagellatus]MBZ9711803.1 SDR family oxidoreductase [Deinococcus multiflagellatus]